MENYNDIDIDEIVQAVLNSEGCSTYSELPPVRTSAPEEDEEYKVSKSVYFGIRKPTFCNIYLTVT